MTTGELVFLRERLFGMRSGLKKPGVQRWTARITVISYLLPLRRQQVAPFETGSENGLQHRVQQLRQRIRVLRVHSIL